MFWVVDRDLYKKMLELRLLLGSAASFWGADPGLVNQTQIQKHCKCWVCERERNKENPHTDGSRLIRTNKPRKMNWILNYVGRLTRERSAWDFFRTSSFLGIWIVHIRIRRKVAVLRKRSHPRKWPAKTRVLFVSLKKKKLLRYIEKRIDVFYFRWRKKLVFLAFDGAFSWCFLFWQRSLSLQVSEEVRAILLLRLDCDVVL